MNLLQEHSELPLMLRGSDRLTLYLTGSVQAIFVLPLTWSSNTLYLPLLIPYNIFKYEPCGKESSLFCSGNLHKNYDQIKDYEQR